MAENLQLFSSKKRKLYLELENECSKEELLADNFSSKSDNESTEISGTQDLEYSEDFDETEISTSSISSLFSEIYPEQGLMHTTSNQKLLPVKTMSDRETTVEKMPSEAELEEFFLTAEKCEQERFAEKYNYDIVKDVPLEGKYQWVQLHP